MSLINPSQLLIKGANAEEVTLDGVPEVLGRFSNPTVDENGMFRKIPTFLTAKINHASPKGVKIIRGGSTFIVKEAKPVAEDTMWLLRMRKQ
jgi:hypothetical protein